METHSEMNRWINELIDLFFSAFEARPMPKDQFISPTYGDPKLEPFLRSIDRRDITPDFIEETRLYPDDWMASMTTEGRLHYLPTVMSLSLQDFYDGRFNYGTLDISIISMLSPWNYHSPPHEWKREVQDNIGGDAIFVDSLRWLFDNEFYFQRGGKLVLALTSQERHALKRYVQEDKDTCSMYPLFVYGIYEMLDGRIAVGDGYSWLPQHEKIAVVDFIDFLTNDCREMLSDEDIKRMLDFRQTIKLD